MVWQTSLVTAPIYLAIQHWREMWISVAVFAVTSLILKFTWYDRLGPGEIYLVKPVETVFPAPDRETPMGVI